MAVLDSSWKPTSSYTLDTSAVTGTTTRRTDYGDATQQLAASELAATAFGVIPMEFGITDIAAGLSASKLYRIIPGATPTNAQIPVLMPFQGSVVGLTLMASGDKTNGTALFDVYRNNALLSGDGYLAECELPDAQYAYQLWPGGALWFAEGHLLDIRVSTSADFTPTTLDVEAILLVIQTEAV